MAAAVLESHPNDFSEEHEISMNALGNNYNSQSAMTPFDGQAPGMPPSAVEGGLNKPKKGKKKKRKRGAGEEAAQAFDGPVPQEEENGN